MLRRVPACLVAVALASCAGGQQPSAQQDAKRRPLAAAIPADAKFAFLLDKPWAKSATYHEVAARLGLAKQYASAMVVARGALGFDLADPAEVQRHGFDAETGVAFFVPSGENLPVFAVGLRDAERAEATVRQVFDGLEERETGARLVYDTKTAPSGDHLTVARRARGGPHAAYLAHRGFLYLRFGEGGDPEPDLLRVAALERGLDREPGYDALAQRLGASDALFYLADAPGGAERFQLGVAGGIALALDLRTDALALHVAARRQPDPAHNEPRAPPPARVDLAAGLPAGATLWLHVGCSPELFWNAISKLSGDAHALTDQLASVFRGDPELRSSFTGNFALALYPSARKLGGSGLGAPEDSPAAMVIAEIAEGREGAVEAMLDRGTEKLATRTRAVVQRRVAMGSPLWRIAGDALVTLQGTRLLVLVRTRPSGIAAPDAGPSGGAPPRWPPEAAAQEIGALADVLRSGRSPLREELHKLHADERNEAAPLVARVAGAILDLRVALRAVRGMSGSTPVDSAPFDAAFARGPAALHQARFEWALGRDGVDAELHWDLPPWVERPPGVEQAERLRESLREARDAAAAHPERPALRGTLASLLLQAAAGQAAREQVQLAAAVAPSDAPVQILLAWVLEHDMLGRLWRPGSDLAGAETAWRKAKQIDPKSYEARIGLALLLERNGGQRETAEPRLARAIDEVRAIRDAWKRGELIGTVDVRLLEAEFFAGLASEVGGDAPRIVRSDARDGLALAAQTVSTGADAAVQESKRVGDGAARAKALTTAVAYLEVARRYGDASNLAMAAGTAVPEAKALLQRAVTDSKVSRVEPRPSPLTDPIAVVQEAAVAAYDSRATAADLARFLASDSPVSRQSARAALLAITPVRWAEILATDVSVASSRDYFQSLSEFHAEGDRESGWRVEVRSNSAKDLWWLVDDGGAPKVLCRAACTSGLGARALALLDARKPAAARRVLDWARDALPKDDPEPHMSLFAAWWNGEPARLPVAAAIAASRGTQSAKAIPVLEKALPGADPALRDGIRVALAIAELNAKHPDRTLQTLSGIDAVPEARRVRVSALLQLKRFPEAERAIDEWLRAVPGDPVALSFALEHGRLVDDLARVEGPARKLVASGKRAAIAENDLAWTKYCHGQLDDDALRLAEVAAKAGRPAAIHTLATLYAESGRLDDARKTILKSIDANAAMAAGESIRFADRYVLARIWEGYGLDDLAGREYGTVLADAEKNEGGAKCIAAAARRRLEGLRGLQ